ncbi:unnamed protein product [Euphydryas editha]|uniref:Uncharacterized protein n=1 Tax=Euphydryas editha TaxID=104508 RepID=A0AAU9U7E2_EUPED|nr:unnamed protein product [Euphydryas editha]
MKLQIIKLKVFSCNKYHQQEDIASTSQPTEIVTPWKQKLITQLRQKTLLADLRKKKIAALKSKTRRLQKKNSKLSDIIASLQSKSLINQETADLLGSVNPENNDFLKVKSKFLEMVELQLHEYQRPVENLGVNKIYINVNKFDKLNVLCIHTRCGLPPLIIDIKQITPTVQQKKRRV